MPKEVQDIDELEALLAGLDDSDLAALEELDAPAAAPAPAAKPVRKRNLKPLKDYDDEPVAQTEFKQAVVTDDEAALADLDLDEATPVTAPVTSQTKMDAAALEAFAVEVIDIIGHLAIKFAMTDEEVAAVVAPVIAEINENSHIDSVAEQMTLVLTRKQEQDKLADKPFEPDEGELGPLNVNTDTGKVTSDDPEVTGEMEKPLSEAPKSDDDDLEALLAGVEAEPTPKPVVTAPTKPVAVTPTRKAGALNTFIDADQLQRDLHFTEATINDGMTRQAALFAHYARLSADATFQSDRAKQQVELLEAQLNQKFRDAMVASGTKFTEKSIDALVIQDSSYQAAQERAHEARAIASMVSSAADSFRHRKDMLIQVGADLRLEKQGELRMKEHPGQRAVEQMGN